MTGPDRTELRQEARAAKRAASEKAMLERMKADEHWVHGYSPDMKGFSNLVYLYEKGLIQL